jgi:hypothetical protein
LEERRGWSFCLGAAFVARVYLHSHSVRVRTIVLYGHHTRFLTLLQRIILMQDIHRTSVNVGFCSRLCLKLFNYSETAVSHLTAAKFEPLMFHTNGFSLSNCKYIWYFLYIKLSVLFSTVDLIDTTRGTAVANMYGGHSCESNMQVLR